jgi:hypothetical protein
MADTKTSAPKQGNNLAVAFAGMQLAGALLDAKHSRDIASINQNVFNAEAAAKNKVRTASTFASAATTGLARFVQDVNNRRRVDQGAERRDALIGAMFLAKETVAANKADRRIRAQEALGAQAAASAFAGTVSTANPLDTAIALQTARAEQREFAAAERRSIFLGRDAGDALGGAYVGQDLSTKLPTVQDPNIAPRQAEPGMSNLEALMNAGLNMRDIMLSAGDMSKFLKQKWQEWRNPQPPQGG